MKYIKTYENLEGVKQIQLNKLAIFKFVGKIREIFNKYYDFDINLKEEDPPSTYLTAYKISSGGGLIMKFFIPDSNYNLLKNIQISLFYGNKDFYKLINDLFKKEGIRKYKEMDTFNRVSIFSDFFSCTFYELNELSEKIIDEFDLINSINKYNL
jgi:hypothetical protein